MPDHVHQIGRVLAVVDRKGGMEPDLVGILTQEPSPDAMEGSCPGQCTADHSRAVTHDQSCDALDTPRHLSGGTAREGHQQYAARIGTIDDQMSDPVCQVLVFPEPAPAITSSGMPGAAFFSLTPCSTAC